MNTSQAPSAANTPEVGQIPGNAAPPATERRRPLRVAIVQGAKLPDEPTRDLEAADVVLGLHASGFRAGAPEVLVVDVLVLRSPFGDPFRHEVELDLAFRDPARAEAQATQEDQELAAALEVLERRGYGAFKRGEKPKTVDGADL